MNDKHDTHDVVVRDGELMAILRPMDAAKSLAMADEVKRAQAAGTISADEAAQQFNAIITVQPHTYAGVPTKDGDIIDPDTGDKLGRVQAGDSFVALSDIQKMTVLSN